LIIVGAQGDGFVLGIDLGCPVVLTATERDSAPERRVPAARADISAAGTLLLVGISVGAMAVLLSIGVRGTSRSSGGC
jgi:hypothetical protein